ncbi:MAG: Rieske (2Fe-2S) protein [Alphaproteobacteria bacterium]
MDETDNNAPPVRPGDVLCRLDDIGEAQSRPYMMAEGEGAPFEFFIVRRGDAVHGYVNNCPHHDRALQWEGESFLTPEGDQILCQAHGAIFDIETGRCLDGPARPNGCLTRVAIEIAGGDIRLAPR